MVRNIELKRGKNFDIKYRVKTKTMEKSEEEAWHRGYKIGYEDAGIHYEMKQDDRRISDYERICNIASSTQYTIKEIQDFMLLSGYNIDQTKKLIELFVNTGIIYLSDVNTLIKLGMFNLNFDIKHG